MAQLNFNDIPLNSVYEFEWTVTEDAVHRYADLVGDHNPLHVDEEFGKKSQFKKNIVHGMLAGSLFSQLVGMHCPGQNCLYLSQTLMFKGPIFFGDKLIVRGTVILKTESTQMMDLKTEILKDGKVVITGQAKVRVKDHV